jgi:hypothetical protein
MIELFKKIYNKIKKQQYIISNQVYQTQLHTATMSYSIRPFFFFYLFLFLPNWALIGPVFNKI